MSSPVCPSCGAIASETARFCGRCGTSLSWQCSACRSANPPQHGFCEQCGAPRNAAPATPAHAAPADDSSDTLATSRAEGERRQIRVMFCDLVGSTQLADELDPEELRAIVVAYHDAATEAIEREGGYVAHYMGDGVLAYFGYPIADAQASVRAVRAGLRVVAAVAELRERFPRMQVRVGVHSGVAVVADMGSGTGRQRRDVVGDTPNIAARVQTAALPGMVAVTEAIRADCEGFITFEPLGPHALKGIATPMELFAAIEDTGASDRIDLAAAQRRLTPLVGRAHELDLLVAAWRRTQLGDPQVVWISGEPGIGKTRLVRELISKVRADGGIEVEFRCSVLHQSSRLYSAAEQFRRYLLAETGELSIEGCEHLADVNGTPRGLAVPVVAGLLGIPLIEPYQAPQGSADRIREHTLDVACRLIEDRAQRQPVLFVVDDIQWIDSTTAELVQRFIGAEQLSPVMTVVAYRSNHPVDIPAVPHHHHIELDRLELADVRDIISHLAPAAPPALLERISDRAEGIPLFAEELGHLVASSPDDSTPSVPTTLRDSLMARIDRLGPELDIVRVLSVFGREAPESLVRAVALHDQQRFDVLTARLLDAGIVVRRGAGRNAVLSFRHALQQEVAYESMLLATRRQLHARVAEVLVSRFAERGVAEPEVSARHLELCGRVEEAVPYLLRAGDRAIAISAHDEARAHLQHALDLIRSMPESAERDTQEVEALVRLGVPTTAVKGYGSVEAEAVYARAQELSEHLGDHPSVYPAMYGLFRTRLLQAEYGLAAELAQRLHGLAQASPQRDDFAVGAARALGSLHFYVGDDQLSTLAFLAPALSAPGVDRPGAYLARLTDVIDPVITAKCYAAWATWIIGDAKEARRLSDDAVLAARRLAHPFTLCLALNFDSWLCQFEGDVDATIARASEGLDQAELHGFPFWIGWARVLLAWGAARRGDIDQPAAMRLGIEEWQAQGSRLGETYFVGLTAETEAESGDLDAALATVDEALALVDAYGEHFWEAELLRLRAEIRWAQGAPWTEVETIFEQAARCAEAQRAGALAERITLSWRRGHPAYRRRR